MIHQAGLLIAFDVVSAASVPHDAVGNIRSHQSWASESHCITHHPDGQPFGSYLMECRKDNPPVAFEDQFSAIHVLLRDADRYTKRSCFLPLTSQQVTSILKKGVDSVEELDAVVETFLPKLRDDDSWERTRRSGFRFGRLLLLRVSDEVLLEEHEKSVSSGTIKNLVLTLNQQHTAAVPCRLFDIILFPSPWPGSDQWTILWLSNTVFAPNSEEIHIPLAAIDLVDYARATNIIEHLSRRLQELPLGQKTSSEYVREIVVSPRRLLKKYSGGHLEDREKTIHELLETGRVYSRLRRDLEHNYVKYEITRKGGVHYLGAITHPRRFLISDRLEEVLDESIQEYSTVRSELEARETAVKEYLRDYLAAEVAESNLSIQRKMQWLTFIAVIAAILALLASVLGDAASRHLLGLPDK